MRVCVCGCVCVCMRVCMSVCVSILAKLVISESASPNAKYVIPAIHVYKSVYACAWVRDTNASVQG